MPDDKRRSYRYKALPEFEGAKLRLRSKEVATKLVNESAGGFFVETSLGTPLDKGQIIQLITYSGSWDVEVIHLQEDDDVLHVGLMRCFSSPNANEKRALSFEALLLLAVVLTSGAMFASWVNGGFSLAPLPAPAVEVSAQAAESPSVGVDFQKAALAPRAAMGLAGVNSLMSPEVAASVRLTEEQKKTLGRMFSNTTGSLTTLHQQTSGRDPQRWEQESNRIVEKTLEQVLWTLSDDQIMQWRKELTKTVTQDRQSADDGQL